MLSKFVSKRSWLLFHLVDIDCGWLQDDPETWDANADYVHFKSFCQDMLVVNDAAERAVKDVQEYAHITRDPAHRDSVIVVANDHRRRIMHFRKDNLNNL